MSANAPEVGAMRNLIRHGGIKVLGQIDIGGGVEDLTRVVSLMPTRKSIGKDIGLPRNVDDLEIMAREKLSPAYLLGG